MATPASVHRTSPFAGLPFSGTASMEFDPAKTLMPFYPKLNAETAEELLRKSAFVDPRDAASRKVLLHGAPGTYIITPTLESGKYKLTVVTETGDTKTETIQKVPGGWINSKPAKIYPTFKEIVVHCCEDVRILGTCSGIPFLTIDQIRMAHSMLRESKPGTFICCAHEPCEEPVVEGGLPLESRLLIMWQSEERIVQEAHCHFVRSTEIGEVFENGAPSKPVDSTSSARAEGEGATSPAGGDGSTGSTVEKREVLRNTSLSGLIEAKLPSRWPAEELMLAP